MKDTLKEIILDNQSQGNVSAVERELNVKRLVNKATILVGVKGCGKSTFINQDQYASVSKLGSFENILRINFSDSRLHSLNKNNLHLIIDSYFLLYPEKRDKEKLFCHFEDIHLIPGWESFIDQILKEEYCEIFISGSSAKLVMGNSESEMNEASFISLELYTFSLKEFLKAKNYTLPKLLTSKDHLFLEKYFESFWEQGGFPETISMQSNDRIKTHQKYLQSILFRDVIERHNIQQPKALLDLVHWLISNVAKFYSINKLVTYLKTKGHKTSKNTVINFLLWLEEAYLLFSLEVFDASQKRRKVNAKKIYCIDHAFVSSISSGELDNLNLLLENLVFVSLKRKYSKIYYYRTSKGDEVNFIYCDENGDYQFIHVVENLRDEKMLKRKLRVLSDAQNEINAKSVKIITRDKESEEVIGNDFEVEPIWKFLIEMS